MQALEEVKKQASILVLQFGQPVVSTSENILNIHLEFFSLHVILSSA